MSEQNTDVKSLAHTKWNCKYHVVFAPKYRRKVFYNEKKEAIREIIRTLCQWKGVEIIEGEVCPDHIHLLLSIPPKMSVSGFMGYLKGKSSLMIFQRFGNMKFAYRNREFWCKCRLLRFLNLLTIDWVRGMVILPVSSSREILKKSAISMSR